MNHEMIRPEQIEGLEVLPNTEADLLETHLGIKFLNKPTKIPLTQDNRDALLKNNPLLPIEYPELFQQSAVVGIYIEKINAYVYWPESEDRDLQRSLHENMHGYTHEQNPTVHSEMFKGESGFIIVKKIRETGDTRDQERFLAISCLDEGISEWGTVETYGRRVVENRLQPHNKTLTEEEKKEWLRTFHKKVIFGLVEYDAADRKKQIDVFLTSLQKAQHVLTLVAQGQPSAMSIATDTFIELAATQYFLGHYFVNECMNLLKDGGMSITEGIQLLIKNPPQTFEQLVQPANYVHQLRGNE